MMCFHVICALTVWQGMAEGRPVVGMAYVDAASRQLGVAQLDDDEQLSALEAIVVQLGAKEAVVCKVGVWVWMWVGGGVRVCVRVCVRVWVGG